MAQTGMILAYYQYSESFLVKIRVFDPLGLPYIGLPPAVMQLIFEI